ncbi:MAG TPA: FxSxx-COOH system tetratricopeptide repeat protein [Ktedonobacteraceae bacterium]|nr:FxSxx-COOH system tetratricopeptide repeat protein [Ktedonobacteraceae bacterium]
MLAVNGSKQGTAVILTALPVEFKAVYAHGDQWQTLECNTTPYKQQVFPAETGTWNVIIAQIGTGNVAAALGVERAITCFHPDIVFFVGVAGGVKDGGIGDVVVATKVYSYESGKATGEEFLSRPDVDKTNHSLIHYAKDVEQNNDWMKRINGDIVTLQAPPRVFFGAIASGEKVIVSAHSEPAQLLRSVYNDTLAVEMEASGVLKAVHANGNIPALIIRGISDLLDNKATADAGGSQERAARHASAFAFEVLARLNPTTFSPSFSVEVRSTREISSPLSEQTTQPSRYLYVPYRRNPLFTGREKLLEFLQKKLTTKRAAALTQAQAISGLGGIGKTQVAVEYAYRYQDKYQAVLWVTAATRETIITDFGKLAALLHLSERYGAKTDIVVAAVKEWFISHTNWLLILDNVDELEIIHEFLPTEIRGHVLITTRIQATGAVATAIPVDKMSSAEGISLLLKRAKLLSTDKPVSKFDRAVAKSIVQELDGLPLALDQAGAYVEETGCSLSDYLALYRHRRMALLSRRGRSSLDYPHTVASTWSLSFQKVEQADPAAADLLRLCAFLDPDAIPETIVTEGAGELGSVLGPVASDPLLLNEAIRVLRRYSLVKRDPEEKILNLHRLVQVVLKDGLSEEMQRLWAERAVRAVNAVFPQDASQFAQLAQRYLSQVEICTGLIEQYHLWFPEAARLLNEAGWFLRESAQYVQAEQLLRLSLTIYEQTLGPEHRVIADNLNRLGLLFHSQGRFSEAEPLYQRAHNIREKVLGPEHFGTAIGLNNFGEFYRAQGRYSEAEPLYQRSLTIREKVLGPDARQTAIVIHNLARNSYAQGKYDKAEALYQRAQRIYEQSLQAEDRELPAVLDHLALLYYARKQYDKAEPLMQRAVDIREKVLGTRHPHFAQSLCGLAKIHAAQGRYTEAEPLMQEALAICEIMHGSNHHSTLFMMENLAELYRLQGRSSDAEQLYARIRDIYESLSLSAMISLKEHEPLYQQLLASYEKVPGPDDPEISGVLETYAMLLNQAGRIQEAAIFDARAKAIRAKSLV